MKEYYLDTNAVRVLNRSLNQIGRNCFTSSLTVMELIAGINKKDFKIRRSVVRGLQSSVEIDWLSPIEIIISSFPRLSSKDRTTSDLKKLVSMLIEAPDLESFKNNASTLEYGLEYFQELDKILGQVFAQDVADKLLELKPMKGSTLMVVPEERALDAIVIYVCKTFAEKLQRKMSSEEVKSIREEYDHSIDTFLKMWASYSNRKLGDWNSPAQNDWVDLHHSVYLRNETSIKFVSDDSMLLKTFNSIWPGRGITIQEFRNLFDVS